MKFFLLVFFLALVSCDEHRDKRFRSLDQEPVHDASSIKRVEFDLTDNLLQVAQEFYGNLLRMTEHETDESLVMEFLTENFALIYPVAEEVQNIFIIAAESSKYEVIRLLLHSGSRLDVDAMCHILSILLKDDSTRSSDLLKEIKLLQRFVLIDALEEMAEECLELALRSLDPEKIKLILDWRKYKSQEYLGLARKYFENDEFDILEIALITADQSVRVLICSNLCSLTLEQARYKYLELFFKMGLTPLKIPLNKRDEVLAISREEGFKTIEEKLLKISRL